MSSDIKTAKLELRQKIGAYLRDISPAVRAVESIELCERLASQMQSARAVLFFAPLPDELDVWPLLETFAAQGKLCALPFFDPATQAYSARQVKDPARETVVGKFGVREPAPACAPVPLNQFDLVLVPGVAFDRRGNRLGRGRGFYDRLLKEASGIKCGVGYNHQLVENVPMEPHDAQVDFIVMPASCLRRKD
jgi:5-formyltetrahydrofolate cyclo-ligase